MNLLEIALNYAKQTPDASAFIHADTCLTWKEVAEQSKKYAEELENTQAKKLMLCLGADIASFLLLIASSAISAEKILVSADYPQKTKVDFMAQFGANAFIQFDDKNSIQILQNEKASSEKVSSPYIYLLTSGTTGPPKCVKHKWETLSAATKRDRKFSQKRWASCYPISHFGGIQVFLQCFLTKGTLILPELANSEVFTKHQIEFLSCTPTYIRQLLMHPTKGFSSSLKHITLGGEIAEQSILDLIRIKLPQTKVTHIYASTELGSMIEVKDGEEGFDCSLIDNKRFKIVENELFIKPSNRSMIQYHNQGKLAQEWVRTKDMVQQKGNRILFIGREDELINVGGYKVNPHQVEKVIREIKEVQEIILVAHKNPIAGNLVKAIVCLNQEVDPQQIRSEILSRCKEKLLHYMVPRLFEFVPKINLTQSHKLKRIIS